MKSRMSVRSFTLTIRLLNQSWQSASRTYGDRLRNTQERFSLPTRMELPRWTNLWKAQAFLERLLRPISISSTRTAVSFCVNACCYELAWRSLQLQPISLKQLD